MSDTTLLVGVGAHKAGTSWTAQYLRSHPSVYISSIKEIHYFDRLFIAEQRENWSVKFVSKLKERVATLTPDDLQYPGRLEPLREMFDRLSIANDSDYRDFFLSRLQGESVFGDISPSYSMLDSAGFSRIVSVHPRVKFLFLMRNPVDRAWSHLRMELRLNPTRRIVDFRRWLNAPGVRLRSDYRRTLTELFAAAPRATVHVDFFERWFTDAAIERFCAFLGVDFVPGDYLERQNAAPDEPVPPAFRELVMDEFADIYRYVADTFPADLPEAWARDLPLVGTA